MAKIDSVGRMRLPPDSGIRTQAHSEREHATSEPVKQALSEWLQVIRQGRQDGSDTALTRALQSILTERAERGESMPRLLPLQVLSAQGQDERQGFRYQVQLGQALLTLSSRTPLQPGQTLAVTLSERGPELLVPQNSTQQRLLLTLIQQQQLTLLPAPQRIQSIAPLQSLGELLRTAPTPVLLQPTAGPSLSTSQPASQPLSASQIQGPANLAASATTTASPTPSTAPQAGTMDTTGRADNTVPPTSSAPQPMAPQPMVPLATAAQATAAASWLAQLLPVALQAWRAAMPAVPQHQTPLSTGTVSTQATPSDQPMPAAQAAPVISGAESTQAPTRTDPRDRAENVPLSGTRSDARVMLSQHWIPQLIEATRQQHGTLTPQALRATWQGWQQAAAARMQELPMPDLSRVTLTPQPTQPTGPLAQPVPLMPVPNSHNPLQTLVPTAQQAAQTVTTAQTAPTATTQAAPSAAATGHQLATTTPAAEPPTAENRSQAATRPADAPATMDPLRLVPLLRINSAQPADQPLPVRETQTRSVPADVWRLVAEQVLDQRLQQLGQSGAPTLQEQLQRRAEQLRLQLTTTYSPDRLRQQLGQRQAMGGENTAASTAVQEQQALLQLRQTLEQVGQQQLVRVLQSVLPDNPAESPRLLQGIPVMSDQQLFWFELERQTTREENAESDAAPTSRWVLDLHFQLPPLAPVCARLSWQGQEAGLTFLTDDTPTLRAFHHHLDQLEQRLQELGLPVSEVQCRYGLPKREAKTHSVSSGREDGHSHKIDVRT